MYTTSLNTVIIEHEAVTFYWDIALLSNRRSAEDTMRKTANMAWISLKQFNPHYQKHSIPSLSHVSISYHNAKSTLSTNKT